MGDSNIHEAIVSSVKQDLEVVSEGMGQVVQQSVSNVKEGKIPGGVKPFEQQVQSIRYMAVTRYAGVKSQLSMRISRAINEAVVEVPPLKILQEQYEKIRDVSEKKRIAEERQKRISKELEFNDYVKYDLYGYSEKKKDKMKSNHSGEPIDAVKKAYINYSLEKKRSLIAGIIVTILCTLADLSIIYSFFQSSNFTVMSSILTAVIVAAILDAPPYILGVLWTDRDEKKRLWLMRGEEDGTSLLNEIKRYSFMMFISAATFLVICFVYIFVRLITFLGGGDFSLAVHAILQHDFKFQATTFSSSDLLTILTPLGTSVVAFSVGMLIHASFGDYVKKTSNLITQDLALKVESYQEQIISCETTLDKLRQAMAVTKGEVWVYYMGGVQRPKEDDVFRNQIIKIFQETNVSLYQQTYEKCAIMIRDEAKLEFVRINREMAVYASDPTSVIAIDISPNERAVLDDIWVTEKGKQQHTATLNDIQEIDKMVKKVTDRLKVNLDDSGALW